MSAKRKGKQGSEQQLGSTNHELESEQDGEKKVLKVWQAFDQIFGIRWSQAFGNDPLGQFKDADGRQNPRMDQWIDALRAMPWSHLQNALKKIREAQKPYDGWLPDLPSFLQFAGRLPRYEPERPPLPPKSWISGICGIFLTRTTLVHGPFSEESMERLAKVQMSVAAKYNAMASEEKPIETFTPEERAEWRDVIEAELTLQFKKTQVDPMPPEQMARLTLPSASRTPASSN